jgi:H+/Cl- antiporter ClcA
MLEQFTPDSETVKERLEEQTTLFFSIVKWVALATAIGAIVGLSTTFFLELLDMGVVWSHQPYYYLALPVCFVLCTWLVKTFAPQSQGHGTEKVIEAVHKRSGRIDWKVIPVKLLATVLTISSGGSVGKEGPSGQIGAGLASFFSDLMRLSDRDRKKLVICGISAGFAGIFGTPISGAIFGLEVLYVGAVMYDVMLPSFIAGIVAYQTCSSLGIEYFHSDGFFVPEFNRNFYLLLLLGGVFFGLCSFLFIELNRFIEKRRELIKWNTYALNFAGGLALAALAYFAGTRYLGLGLETIDGILIGTDSARSYDFLLKMLFTIMTLSFGGSGGVVTPTFFIGVTAGAVFGTYFGLPPQTFAAIGMVSLLSGAANTPIAASIMGMELFGAEIAPYAAISCVIAYLMTGHRSLFPSQILRQKKDPSFHADLDVEIQESDVQLKKKERMLVYRWWKVWRYRDRSNP